MSRQDVTTIGEAQSLFQCTGVHSNLFREIQINKKREEIPAPRFAHVSAHPERTGPATRRGPVPRCADGWPDQRHSGSGCPYVTARGWMATPPPPWQECAPLQAARDRVAACPGRHHEARCAPRRPLAPRGALRRAEAPPCPRPQRHAPIALHDKSTEGGEGDEGGDGGDGADEARGSPPSGRVLRPRPHALFPRAPGSGPEDRDIRY